MTLWWNKKWGKDKICGITLTRLRPGKDHKGVSKCVYLKCGHGFYRKCLQKWIITKFNSGDGEVNCPMCRKNFNVLDGFI